MGMDRLRDLLNSTPILEDNPGAKFDKPLESRTASDDAIERTKNATARIASTDRGPLDAKKAADQFVEETQKNKRTFEALDDVLNALTASPKKPEKSDSPEQSPA